MSQQHILIIIILLGLVCVGLIGCQLFEDEAHTPTTAATGASADLAGYAQMDGGSVVVDGHQINLVVGAGSVAYGEWLYVELNEQDAVDQPAGEHQTMVTLREVMLEFSGLPDGVTQIVLGVKAVHDDQDTTYTECGTFAVVNGSVRIPVALEDLTAYFGATHLAIWLKPMGGQNGQGMACGATLTVRGTMLGSQEVTISKELCFGTNSEETITPTTTPTTTPVACTGAVLTFGGAHTDCECEAAGGRVYHTGATGTICRFSQAFSASCPAGWTQAANWQRMPTNAELPAVVAAAHGDTSCAVCPATTAQLFVPTTFQNLAAQGLTQVTIQRPNDACAQQAAHVFASQCTVIHDQTEYYDLPYNFTIGTINLAYRLEIGCY